MHASCGRMHAPHAWLHGVAASAVTIRSMRRPDPERTNLSLASFHRKFQGNRCRFNSRISNLRSLGLTRSVTSCHLRQPVSVSSPRWFVYCQPHLGTIVVFLTGCLAGCRCGRNSPPKAKSSSVRPTLLMPFCKSGPCLHALTACFKNGTYR